MKLRDLVMAYLFLGVLMLVSVVASAVENESGKIPAGFVDIHAFIPTIEVELRYFSEDNFVGERIDGYFAEKAFLSLPAAQAIEKVQNELREFGFGLKIFDAYRPQRAVDHFVRWAEDLSATKMKSRFYPSVEKKNLFRDGYIADRSGHSRGSTVDLTIISLQTGAELEMGTSWDFFDPRSWSLSDKVTEDERAKRMLLRSMMTGHGFRPLEEEWWHFTLENEPYAETYFDFEIR